MAYSLYDQYNNEVTHHNLQDKGPWCQHGSTKELIFIEKYGHILNMAINPEKESNPYAPDLLNQNTNNLADLKTQNTPFFQAKAQFSLDPQFTVVFNQKDQKRYQELYPNIEIYFWVDWIAVKFIGNNNIPITIKPMTGVWYISFGDLNQILQDAPIHEYRQRIGDKINANYSYVISLQNPSFQKVV